MSIKKKLVYSFLVIFVLLFIMGIINLYSQQKTANQFEEITKNTIPKIIALNHISMYIFRGMHETLSVVVSQKIPLLGKNIKRKQGEEDNKSLKDLQEKIEEIKEANKKFIESSQRLIKLFNGKSEKKQVKKIIKKGKDILTLCAKIIEEDEFKEIISLKEDLEELEQEFANYTEQAININFSKFSKGHRQAFQNVNLSTVHNALGSLITIVISVWLGLFLYRKIAKPIVDLQAATKKITEGDFSQKVVIQSDDELGKLAKSFNNMAEFLVNYEETILQQQEELESTNVELKQSSQHKSEFLASMTHELRTPLNAIIGYSELLLEDCEDCEDYGDKESMDDLNKIQSAGKHLLSLINDVLDISKIEAGKIEIYNEAFDIPTLLKEAEATLTSLAQKNNNKLEFHYDKDLGTLYSDTTKIRQCLFNLISNSCKFTKNGEINVSICKTDKVIIKVQDTGIGIEQEKIKKLFSPFSQADSSTTRIYGGTGLGLAISREFCEILGGSIHAESELGKGSTFTITLPCQTGPATNTENTIENLTNPRHKILVIDDDLEVQEVIKRFINRVGIHAEMANNGEEGLKKAKELDIEAILLDVKMPGINGWEVLKKLKMESNLKNIPVIIHTTLEEKNTGFALGASEYLVKPINRDTLINTLSKYLIPRQCASCD